MLKKISAGARKNQGATASLFLRIQPARLGTLVSGSVAWLIVSSQRK